jgi:GNAT superfamily N-acetyltransferase
MMPVEHAEPTDWQRVRAVRLRALADAPDAFGTTLAEDEARSADSWRDRLAREDHATFLAVVDGRDVGMAVGGPSWRGDTTAGLYGMWVAPEARGQGVGDRLIEAVVAWARSRGHPRILLDVGDENAPAIRLYERHGFVPTGATGCVSPARPQILEHERALDLGSRPTG